MRRAFAVRPLLAMIALSALTGACVKAPDNSANATPIPDSDDFAFEELLDSKPSASPSPSPTLVPVGAGGGRSSSSGSGTGSAPAAAPAPTAGGRVTCPSGTVTASMTDFSADDAGKTRNGQQKWTVRVRGQVLNKTTRAVRDIRVETILHVSNSDEESETVTIAKWVGRGSTADWGTEFDYESENEPDEDDTRVIVRGWSWGDSSLSQCPTHGSTG